MFRLLRIAALSVAFVTEHLLLEPLLALAFGNYSFYRKRGHFYDFRLGLEWKNIEN